MYEERPRTIFAHELERRGLDRCRSYWLCAMGGYCLGVLSGLLGTRAIVMKTVAVERVVLRHLDHQLEEIGSSDAAASTAILALLHEEQLHHDESLTRLAAPGPLRRMIDNVVSAATESVIRVGMRV